MFGKLRSSPVRRKSRLHWAFIFCALLNSTETGVVYRGSKASHRGLPLPRDCTLRTQKKQGGSPVGKLLQNWQNVGVDTLAVAPPNIGVFLPEMLGYTTNHIRFISEYFIKTSKPKLKFTYKLNFTYSLGAIEKLIEPFSGGP